MTLNEYQQIAVSTYIYPKDMGVIYPALGLCGEAGEVAEKVKKEYRDKDGAFDETSRDAIANELGDVLWYVAAFAYDLGYSLDEIAKMNEQKITSRFKRNAIHGDGDDR